MSGKLPIDRVRETRQSPKVFLEHSERLAQQEAELRDADDPVSGARPPAADATDDPDGELPTTEERDDA